MSGLADEIVEIDSGLNRVRSYRRLGPDTVLGQRRLTGADYDKLLISTYSRASFARTVSTRSKVPVLAGAARLIYR